MNQIKQELQSNIKDCKAALSVLDKVVQMSAMVLKEKDKMLQMLGNSRTGLKYRTENEFYEQYDEMRRKTYFYNVHRKLERELE